MHITSVMLAIGQQKRALVHTDVFILTVLNEAPGDTFLALQRSSEE